MPKILVVDDDPEVLTLTSDVLTDEGFAVVTADNGAAALALLERCGSLAVMVTDVVMPGMNGFQLADQAKSRHPGLRVLFVSGHLKQALPPPGSRHGHVVAKPWRASELCREVRALLP